MKKLSILLPLLMLIILSCGKESPISTEEKSQRGTISGTVTDSTGKPISGVSATLSSPDGKVDLSGFTTATDTAGNYTIQLVPAGLYNVTFTHAYYRDSVISNVQIAKAEDVARININLRPKRAKLSGTIVDQFGKPVYQAAVLIKPWGLTTQTNSAGAFSIEGITLDSATIVVNKKNYAALSESYEFVPETLTVNRAYVLSEKFGSATGTILTADSKPHAGVIVTTVPGNFIDTTDATGTYSFSGLRLDQLYSLTVTAAGYVSESFPVQATDSVPNVAIKPFMLDIIKGSISGTVTDTTGAPIKTATVTASNGTNSYSTTTDTIGAYILSNMDHGTYTVTFHKEMYGIVTLPAELSLGQKDISLGALLKKLPGKITGVVTDENGTPLTGVAIIFGTQTSFTDSTGAYEFLLGELGKYTLTYALKNYTALASPEITLTDAAPTAVQNMKLPVRTGTISGVVTNNAKAPLAGVTISNKAGTVLATTDANGTYTIASVPFGVQYTYVFSLAGYQSAEMVGMLDEQNPTLALPAILTEIPGSITGTVTNELGNLLNGVVVTATVGDSSYTTASDENGAYAFSALIHGTVTLSFTASTYAAQTIQTAITLANKDHVVNAILKKSPGKISGIITDMNGIPLEGVAVTAGITTILSDSTGAYTFAVGELTSYTLTFAKANYISHTSTLITLTDAAPAALYSVKLAPKTGTVSGTITSGKTPLAGVIVSVTPGAILDTTDANGSYSLVALQHGIEYSISWTKNGYAVLSGKVLLNETLPSAVLDTALVPLNATITGIVKDTAGGIASGATITLKNSAGSKTATATIDGTFSLTDVTPGKYQLSVGGETFADTLYPDSIVIGNGETKDLGTIRAIRKIIVTYGSITGIIKSSTAEELGVVTVTLTPGGITTAIPNAGTQTTFTLSNVEEKTYQLTISTTGHRDTTLAVNVKAGEVTNIGTVVLTSTTKKYFDRSILGSFVVHKDTVDSVIAEYREISATAWEKVKCTYDKAFGFSGILKVNESGSAWIVRVKTYAKGHKIGESAIAQFTKNSGDVNFASSFTNPTNAIPTVTITAPATANIGTDVSFTGNEIDSLGGTVVSWEWEFSNGTKATGKKVTQKFLKIGTYTATCTVTDDDGNTQTATHAFTIVNQPSVIVNFPNIVDFPYGSPEYWYTQNDTVTYSYTINDENAIAKVIWYFYDLGTTTPTHVDSTMTGKTTTMTHVWNTDTPIGGSYKKLMKLSVIDEFNDTTTCSTWVSITNLKPKITNVTVPATVKTGDSIKIQFTATDDGHMSYSYDAGATGTFTACDSGKISFVAPNVLDADYPVKIKVTDEDGNDSIVSVTVGVNVWVKDELSGSTNTVKGIASAPAGNYWVISNPWGAEGWSKIIRYNTNGDSVATIDFTDKKALYITPYGTDNFIVTGSSANTPWICAFNSSGDKLFETISTLQLAELTHISPTSDGGFIACGSMESSGKCVYAMKLSNTGSIEWEMKDRIAFTSSSAIFQNADGTYSLFCSDGSLITLDKDGKQVGAKISVTNNSTTEVKKASDGNYLAIGINSAVAVNIDKISPSGTQIWQKKLPDYVTGFRPSDIIETASGNILYIAEVNNYASISLLNADGFVQIPERKLIDKSGSKVISVVESPDGGFVVIGTDGTKNIILKTDADLKTIYAK